MTLAEASESYQASLEHHRAAVDYAPDEVRDQLAEDVRRALAAMETAWLEYEYRLIEVIAPHWRTA